MKPTHLVALVLSASILAACGTTMSTQADGSFLSNYEGLATTEDNSVASRTSRVRIDPSRIDISEVTWRAQSGASLSAQEQTTLLTKLRHELVQQTRALPAATEGRPVRVRAAITRVETVSPGLNTLATVLLIGPLDRGGMAVEIEAVDAETGRQLAGLRMGYYAPLSEFAARFSKLAPAEIALQQAAKSFAALLQPEAAAIASAR